MFGGLLCSHRQHSTCDWRLPLSQRAFQLGPGVITNFMTLHDITIYFIILLQFHVIISFGVAGTSAMNKFLLQAGQMHLSWS